MNLHRTLPWKLSAAALLLSNLACAQDNPPLPLQNGNFEDGTSGWTMREKVPMSALNSEAAHSGKMGLRVNDDDPAAGSSALSAPVSIAGGEGYKLNFWLKTAAGSAAVVQYRFYDTDHKTLSVEATRLPIKTTGNEWHQMTLLDRAPQNAATLAVWIHSYSGAKAILDFDDFTLQKATDIEMAQVPAAAVAPEKADAAPATAPQTVTAAEPTGRKARPRPRPSASSRLTS